MTLRERMQRRLERREDWAAKAAKKADANIGAALSISQRFEFGQPILVGHHSERKARADKARMQDKMSAGVQAHRLSERHASKAAGIERQLERSIYSDDTDATEKLQAKLAQLEDLQAKMRAANTAIRRHAKAGREVQVAALVELGFTTQQASKLLTPDFARRVGFADYQLRNNGAEIRRCQKRLAELTAIAERQPAIEAEQQAAREAGGVLVRDLGQGQCSVRFPDRPDRDVLDELRQAGYRWAKSDAVWIGSLDRLPAQFAGAEVAPAAPVQQPKVAVIGALVDNGDGTSTITFTVRPPRQIELDVQHWGKRIAPKTYQGRTEWVEYLDSRVRQAVGLP